MCHTLEMALSRQSKNTYRKIKAWLRNQASPEALIAHARFDRETRELVGKRLRDAEAYLAGTEGR